jgi:predicted O-methyltransferase YrrM
MDSLSTGQVANVLKRLYREAEEADRPLMELLTGADTSLEQMVVNFLDAEAKDYRALYRSHAGHFLSVSPSFGRFIYMCARACRASRIVEFGTSFGISTLHLACALRDNGGGHLITTELEASKAVRARENLVAAGLADLVEIRVGDALETLEEVGPDVDIVLLDGAFSLYLPVLKLLEPRLRSGALVIGENAFEQSPGYIDYIRDPRNGYMSMRVPIDAGRGNEFTIITR